MKIRKSSIIMSVIATVILTMFASLTANAATTPSANNANAQFAAEATSYQNSVLAKALINNPSGVRISPDKVEWNNGSVIMAVPAGPDASSPPCPNTLTTHWTCVYNQTNWNGTQLEFKDQGYYQDLYAYGARHGGQTRSTTNSVSGHG